MAVVRALVLLLLGAGLLLANTFKLYLKDGDYQLVREYKIDGSTVRYYSTERSDWEEIPVELCDLKKTEAERQRTAQELQKETKLADDEEKLERAQRQEAERIPMNPGTYFVEGNQVKSLAYAESNLVKSKKRSALQKITPIPVVAGKATVEVKGEHSSFVVHNPEPEFYVRLEKDDRIGIVQLTPKKDSRIVEDVAIVPVTNEPMETAKDVEVFQKELMGGLYKIWPQKPLAAGEYAVVEFTPGELDLRIWDFAVAPAAPTPGR